MPPPPGPMRLELTTTSLNNCIISNASDAVFFEVVTPKWTPNQTKISRRDPNTRELEIVAEFERHGKQSNVRLRGEQFRPANEWLKKDKESKNQMTGCFRGKDGKTYQWRVRKRRLELVRSDEPDKPLATFHKERRHFMIFLMRRHPYLEVQPSCMETLDSLIVSFLIMEQKRRRNFKDEEEI